MPRKKEPEYFVEEYLPTAGAPMDVAYDDVAGAGGLDIFRQANDMHLVIKELLEDKLIEKLKQTPLWPVIAKSFILTFIPPNEIPKWELLFESYVCAWLRSLMPGDTKNKEIIDLIRQARFIFYANLHRAVGTLSPNVVNERIAQVTQIKFGMMQQQMRGEKKGFLGRLFNRG